MFVVFFDLLRQLTNQTICDFSLASKIAKKVFFIALNIELPFIYQFCWHSLAGEIELKCQSKKVNQANQKHPGDVWTTFYWMLALVIFIPYAKFSHCYNLLIELKDRWHIFCKMNNHNLLQVKSSYISLLSKPNATTFWCKKISLIEIMVVLLLLLLLLLVVDLEVETSRIPWLWTHTSSNSVQ